MRILSTALATSDGGVYQTEFNNRGGYRPVHVEISGAGSVTIKGRAAPDLDWITLASFTSTGAEMVAAMREITASVSGNTGQVEVEYDG